jgi:hypothetical protein
MFSVILCRLTIIDFLGHQVSADGLAVDPGRAAALQDWPEPTNLHELRSCLGTFNFWRQYIRGYANIVTPLTALTKKGVRWRWRTDVEGAALKSLKSTNCIDQEGCTLVVAYRC